MFEQPVKNLLRRQVLASVNLTGASAALRVSRMYVSLSVRPTGNCTDSAPDGAGMLRIAVNFTPCFRASDQRR